MSTPREIAAWTSVFAPTGAGRHVAEVSAAHGCAAHECGSLHEAVLRTLLYADLFGYPMTVEEIHRYLVGVAASQGEVAAALESEPLRARLVSQPPYYALAERHLHFTQRRDRGVASSVLWPLARRYARRIAALPFVQMVAVTGALAVDNPRQAGDDLDYIIVAQPGRTWVVRLLAIVLVRLAQLRRVELCPNYILDSAHLEMAERTLFTAHELAQMAPCYGLDMHRRLLTANAWARAFLPNAFDANGAVELAPSAGWRWLKRLGEALLGGRLGDALERWERERKIRRLAGQALDAGTLAACFNEGVCKGHMHDYGRRIQTAFDERVRAAGLDGSSSACAPAGEG
jgi:hypothetical protein